MLSVSPHGPSTEQNDSRTQDIAKHHVITIINNHKYHNFRPESKKSGDNHRPTNQLHAAHYLGVQNKHAQLSFARGSPRCFI